jgi:hypothetical protein
MFGCDARADVSRNSLHVTLPELAPVEEDQYNQLSG